MSAILERKAIEARAKRDALLAEFEDWLADSEEGKPYEKHHTQIRRIVAMLRAALPQGSAPALDGRRQYEESILGVFALWDFFRGKLMLRRQETFSGALYACDEFAWACYAPWRDLLPEAKRREPPLVFLNGGWSPFAVSRSTQFRVDRAAGGWLPRRSFSDVVEKLPIPMIGLPWLQASHLPDLLVIAHEMGHVLEWEFGWSGSLDQAVRAAAIPPNHVDGWLHWRREVFADFYGCIAGGQAFASSLLDFIALTPHEIGEQDSNAVDVHPPSWLRIELLAVASELMESGSGAAIRRHWAGLDYPVDDPDRMAADAAAIIAALDEAQVETGGGKKRIREVMAPPAGLDPVINEIRLGARTTPGKDRQMERRRLIAASRKLFEADPEGYYSEGAAEAVILRLRSLHEPGVRGADGDELTKALQQDALAGAALFA